MPVRKKIIQICVVLLVFLFLFLIPGIRSGVDSAVGDLFNKVRGELEPDSNIVLIHISGNDIERIGPWPIKRNYYALLINQLSKLNRCFSSVSLFMTLATKFPPCFLDGRCRKPLFKNENLSKRTFLFQMLTEETPS